MSDKHRRGRRIAAQKRLTALVRARWREQDQRCIWCGDWCDIGTTPEQATANRLFLELGRDPTPQEVRNKRASVEHILPRDLGGGDDAFNIVCACVSCNTLRSNAVHYWKAKPHVAARLPKKVRRLVLMCGIR